jgi:tetratricopeptide (TPR) repeat protein
MIDWSYNLLSEPERVLLRRLAIFAGGWTLEGAEAICVGGGVEADQVLDLLTALIDKSLVLVETHHGEARYRLLETLRQYAWDQAVGAREATEVQRRHRAWYLDLAERADAGMHGPEETMWLNRLEGEHDNLRAALGWSTTAEGDAETRLRLAAALHWFWDGHTHWGEGRKWLETALAESRHIKSTARVKALWEGGRLAWMQGDNARALALCDESLALGRELGDQTGIARALTWRGLVALRQRDFDVATALFEEGLELARKLEDKWFMGTVLAQMGATARVTGDYAKAVELCEESLAIYRTLNTERWIAYSLRLTGHAVRLLGDMERAAELYRESLALFGKTEDKWIATECVEGLALIASAQRNSERAARLFGAADAARETFGITMPRPAAGDQEHFWPAIPERPERTAFAAAWAEGRAMTLEQAIEYALTFDQGSKGSEKKDV